MGKHFGELGVIIRGIVTYRLSPHEMKPFAGAIKYGIPNFVPRTMSTLFRWLPQTIMGVAIYYYVERSYYLAGRKNPKDYIDEVNPNPPPPPPPPTEEESAKKKKCQ